MVDVLASLTPREDEAKKKNNTNYSPYSNQLNGSNLGNAPLSGASPQNTAARTAAPAAPAERAATNTTNYDTANWSKYDQGLPDEGKSTINSAKQEYAIAQKAGDEAAMKAAYNKAQKARAEYGSYIDTAGDGSGYTYFGKDSWSAADKNLAAEAQAEILKAKQGYALAENDGDRQYWNTYAENMRKQTGYTGGKDGSEYNQLGILDKEYSDNSKYESAYTDKLNQLLQELENSKFSYDHNTDASYKSYLDAFTRQGNSAAETGLAQTAANTGGIASSYAAAVANQAQQAYAKKAADMIPQLEQSAYERYAQELSNKLGLANTYNDLDQSGYDRFNNDRTFDYQTWKDNYTNAYQRDYDNTNFNWLKEQLEKQLADTTEERKWQTGENTADRDLQKYLASLS